MQRKRGVLVILGVIFSVWIFLIMKGKVRASFLELSLASSLYFACCVPTVIYSISKSPSIPYLPIFGIFFFIYFGLSVFVNYDLFTVAYLSKEAISKCLGFALLGYIFMMIAFYSPLAQILNFLFKPLNISWDHNKAYRLGVFTGIFGNIIFYFSLRNMLPLEWSGVVDFLISLSRFGAAVLFMLQLKGMLKFKGKILFWMCIFIPRVVLDLSTGSIFSVIFDFILLFFIYLYHRKSIPWLKIGLMIIFFFFMASARNEFRVLTWFGGEYGHISPLDKGVLYVRLMFERLLGQQKAQYETTYNEFSARTDSLVTFAQVVELTPGHIPYWGGHTYETLFTSFIPRFIMPGKPIKNVGQDFGHRYFFLDPSDLVTSYNLPLLVEMYINFGEVGIIVGMFILGLIFRILYILFNKEEAGEGGILISALLFISVLNMENYFSMIFGAIIQYSILFYIIAKSMALPIKRIESIR